MKRHEKFMQRCLQLAANGLGTTRPNPLVGAVLVYENKIIAEGWHQKVGGPHAEVVAIEKVEDIEVLKKSTLYVNLEPCNHFGKTPPCSHLILEKKIPQVVIANSDSNPQVNGTGIQHLKNHGVEVIQGVLEKEASHLNRRFFCFHQNKRPYIILKWAQTANNFFAPKEAGQKWITNSYSKQLSHRWRTEEAAILIGKNTAIIDEPQLTPRLWAGNAPLKLLWDRQLEVPSSNAFFREGAIWVLNKKKWGNKDNVKFIQVSNLSDLMNALYAAEIQSLIVEGGIHTLNQFITSNLWDEARIITSDISWNDGLKAPKLNGYHTKTMKIENDVLNIYQSKNEGFEISNA